MSDTWVATDGLGHKLPGANECPKPRKDRFVGVFYVGWHGVHGYDEANAEPLLPGLGVMPKKSRQYRSPYNITEILAADPIKPKWGPENAFHYACEPELGYYLSNDNYVIRKHAGMLTQAGVDVLFLDVTNAFTYTDVYLNLMKTLARMRQSGERVPQVAFMAYFNHVPTVQTVYEKFYKAKVEPDLWFRWLGKPLLLSPTDGLPAEIQSFFTIRHTWAWSSNAFFGDGKDKWTFLDHHPQKPGWHESPDKPEQISVVPAQHATTNIGRSFHNGKQPPLDQQRPADGLCFAEQWKRALEVDPQIIFICDWNEWTAMRMIYKGSVSPAQEFLGKPLKPGDSFFVDQYNQEYSRSIEPMKGGHGDSYYYQMVANIRRFKGVRPIPKAGPSKTIQIDGAFEDWVDVTPAYFDAAGDVFPRRHPGWGRIREYVNNSGRNDLVTLKVADDNKNLYFCAETRSKLSLSKSPNWMLLFIDADCDAATGWCGYEYCINKVVVDSGTTTVSRFDDKKPADSQWVEASRVKFAQDDKHLELAVPKSVLGLADGKPLRFDFKWADNIKSFNSVDEFSLNGDSAPDRRFNYRYQR